MRLIPSVILEPLRRQKSAAQPLCMSGVNGGSDSWPVEKVFGKCTSGKDTHVRKGQ